MTPGNSFFKMYL